MCINQKRQIAKKYILGASGLVPIDPQLVTSWQYMFSFTLRLTVSSGEIISAWLCPTRLKIIKPWGLVELPNAEKCKYTRIYVGGYTQSPLKLAESAIHALFKYLTSKNVCILSTERELLSVHVHVTLFFT